MPRHRASRRTASAERGEETPLDAPVVNPGDSQSPQPPYRQSETPMRSAVSERSATEAAADESLSPWPLATEVLQEGTLRTSSTFTQSERSRQFFTPVSVSLASKSSAPQSASARSPSSASSSTSAHVDTEGSAGERQDTERTAVERVPTGTPHPGGGPLEEALVQDPQTVVLHYVMKSDTGRVPISEIKEFVRWRERFEGAYGDLSEFLHSYQSLFLVSPVDDTVTLRVEAILNYDRASLVARRAMGNRSRVRANLRNDSLTTDDPDAGTTGTEAYNASFSSPVGSISYSCVAESFDLDVLAAHYRGRFFDVVHEHGVLRLSRRAVTSSFLPAAETSPDASFDLFLFPTGCVIWWGLRRSAHTIVEDDFLSAQSGLESGVRDRYSNELIGELFPVWCTFEVEPSAAEVMGTGSPQEGGPATSIGPLDEDWDAALVRFSRRLHYDHYILPANPAHQAQVMLAVSHCLARSARVDYLEHITQATHRRVSAIPSDFKNLLEYFSTKRAVDRLSGELLVAQLAIKSLKDAPEFLWEMPWLQGFYDLTDAQYASAERLSWFSARSDALLEQLSGVKARQFRLFMLGSDVFLIVLLILDVIFMSSRLVVKLYFVPSVAE